MQYALVRRNRTGPPLSDDAYTRPAGALQAHPATIVVENVCINSQKIEPRFVYRLPMPGLEPGTLQL